MCPLMLERLWEALLVIAESWGCLTGLLGVPWGTLLCCVGLLFMVSRGWNSRSTKAQGRSCPACHEVPGNRGDTAERKTPANDTGRPCGGGQSSHPTKPELGSGGHTPDAVPSRHSGPSGQGMGESQPPTLPKATDEKPTLRASQKDGKQLGKKMLDDWNGNTAFPERAEVLAQDFARCRQKLKEEEEKEGLLRSNARAEQDLKDSVGQLLSVSGTLLHTVPTPAPLRHLLDGGSLDIKQKREVGNCKHPVLGAEVALKADMHDADSPVSPQSPERARSSSKEQKQVNEEMRKQTAALQAEESSLRCEILQLESHLLQLKLQRLLELHQERTMQLESQIAEEEKRCINQEETDLVQKPELRVSDSPAAQQDSQKHEQRTGEKQVLLPKGVPLA